MTLGVGDKAVVITLRGGERIVARSGPVSVGDRVVLVPLQGGGYAALQSGSSAVSAPRVGNVTCWGYISGDQFDVPSGLEAIAGDAEATPAEGDTLLGIGSQTLLYPLRGGGRVCLSTGAGRVVTLAEDGVIAWGDDDDLRNVPVGLAATALDSGTNHILALEADGTVVAWGRNNHNQLNVPAGLTAKYIAAGDHHSLAIKTDGTVAAWGANDHGQLNVPAGLTAVAVAGGYDHSLALRADGSVVAWGGDHNGLLDIPAGLVAIAITANGYVGVAIGHLAGA